MKKILGMLGLNRNRKREFLSIVIHCSASDRYKTTIEDIRAWHVKGNGWSDIGYHTVITGDGIARKGRDDSLIGAGAAGWNEDSLHICLTGNFDIDRITTDDPQYKTLVQVVAIKLKKYPTITLSNVIGHRDVYLRLGIPQAKSCPGKYLYELLPQLRRDVAKYL